MLPPAMEGRIEDTVDLNLKYPSVSERYWTKYYFIPKDKRRPGEDGADKGGRGGEAEDGGGGVEGEGRGADILKRDEALDKEEADEDIVKEVRGGTEKEEAGNGVDVSVMKGDRGEEKERDKDHGKSSKGEKDCNDSKTNGKDKEKNDNGIEEMKIDYTNTEADKDDRSIDDDSSLSLSSQQEEGGASGQRKHLDSRGHVCVMVHTNKLCLVTLSPKHPALAPGMEITKVSYSVGKFNRLDNQVSGKGKRGAQMMGPQSPVCIITCADGSQHAVLAGVHGKLVEVNERLLTNPKLVSERPDAEGYLAVVLPPLRNGDTSLKRLLTSEQYWGQER